MTREDEMRRAFERGWGSPIDWSRPVTESDRELGRAILTDILGGPPTVERIKYWYARERQKQRRQIHLVSDKP
jgi:hypothetical protein